MAVGHPVCSTEVIMGAYADLKVRIKGRPLPHLVEYDKISQRRIVWIPFRPTFIISTC